ncbi:MAG TPA: hypothetical protein VGD91_27685 [Trebonia sp.]
MLALTIAAFAAALVLANRLVGRLRRLRRLRTRTLELLDVAEARQGDPEHLELLFQLDHLATRARRNAENLLTLGGRPAGTEVAPPGGSRGGGPQRGRQRSGHRGGGPGPTAASRRSR